MKQAGLISGPPSQGKEDDGYEGKGALLRRIRPDTGGQQAGAKNVDGVLRSEERKLTLSNVF
jgi:hypothetical protein